MASNSFSCLLDSSYDHKYLWHLSYTVRKLAESNAKLREELKEMNILWNKHKLSIDKNQFLLARRNGLKSILKEIVFIFFYKNPISRSAAQMSLKVFVVKAPPEGFLCALYFPHDYVRNSMCSYLHLNEVESLGLLWFAEEFKNRCGRRVLSLLTGRNIVSNTVMCFRSGNPN